MNRFSNILFIADSVADNAAGFDHALTVANNNQAKLTVLGLVDAPTIPRLSAQFAVHKVLKTMAEQLRQQLLALVQGTVVAGSDVEVEIRVGKGFIEIIRDVMNNQRDLVIKIAEPAGGVRQRLLRSADMKLLRQCPCPVWLTKSTGQQGDRPVLAAVDYDQDDAHEDTLNPRILAIASALALAECAELHIVHAWNLEYETFLRSAFSGASKVEVDLMLQHEEKTRKRWLDALLEKHRAAQGGAAIDYLEPQLHMIKGDASDTVPAIANEIGAEVIVMGTVGRAGVPGLIIGNTAENILNQIDCSVLTVKPAGFVSPVPLDPAQSV